MSKLIYMLLAATVMVGADAVAANAAKWGTCVSDEMEAGINNWRRGGAASFAHDKGKAHAGKGSARITVSEPAYQRRSDRRNRRE